MIAYIIHGYVSTERVYIKRTISDRKSQIIDDFENRRVRFLCNKQIKDT